MRYWSCLCTDRRIRVQFEGLTVCHFYQYKCKIRATSMNLQSGPIMDPSAQSESPVNLIFHQAVNLLSGQDISNLKFPWHCFTNLSIIH